MKRLYRATTEITVIFVAEEGEEEKAAEEFTLKDVELNGVYDAPMSVREVTADGTSRPEGWTMHSLVWGTDEDTTLEEAIKKYARKKPVSR